MIKASIMKEFNTFEDPSLRFAAAWKASLVYSEKRQKQLPELFCEKKCSYELCNIYKKTPVLEFLF